MVGFSIFSILVFVAVVAIFGICFALIFSGNFRRKFYKRRIDASKQILDENTDSLKHMVTTSAEISKDAIKTTAGAIKEGITGEKETAYCKHCGAKIDDDSKYCSKCGKEQ